jgi:hypothetical protein
LQVDAIVATILADLGLHEGEVSSGANGVDQHIGSADTHYKVWGTYDFGATQLKCSCLQEDGTIEATPADTGTNVGVVPAETSEVVNGAERHIEPGDSNGAAEPRSAPESINDSGHSESAEIVGVSIGFSYKAVLARADPDILCVVRPV